MPERLLDILRWMHTQTGFPLKAFRTDQGTEFKNSTVDAFMRAHGVTRQFSTPHTPEQNSKIERLHRTLNEKARALLAASTLPPGYWPEAYLAACFLRNQLPTEGRSQTPLELFLGVRPDLSTLKVFGCRVHVRVRPKHKLDFRSVVGRLVGFIEHHAYWVLLESGEVVQTCDVHFAEDSTRTPASESPLEGVPYVGQESEGGAALESQPPGARGSHGETDCVADTEAPDTTGTELVPALPSVENPLGGISSYEEAVQPAVVVLPRAGQRPAPRAYPKRKSRSVGQYEELMEPLEEEETIAMLAGVEEVGSHLPPTPQTHKEAMRLPEKELWKEAERSELDSLASNGTWTLQPLPRGARALPVKWVYALKTNPQGKITRFKARLVVKGFRQIPGVDFFEVFAPVGKYTTLRVLLALVAQEDWELHQVDIKTAFLNGKLEEEIWVSQPEGYEEGGPKLACHLHKSLYGLKQAPREWYKELARVLKCMGFVPCKADPGLFSLDKGLAERGLYAGTVYILVYVDDMLIAACCSEDVKRVKDGFKEVGKFELHDLSEPEVFLGWEISRDRSKGTISLSQQRAVKGLLEQYKMEDCKPYKRPLNAVNDLTEGDNTPLDQSRHTYRQLVGSVLYLSMCTRPDIAQAVGALSRFCSDPCESHWTAAKALLRYLRGTLSHKLVLGGGAPGIVGYTDADFAGERIQYRSTSGHVFLLNGGAVSWLSKLQETIATSTSESEYMACFMAVKEAVWLRQLLDEFGVPHKPVPIYSDSQAAMSIAANPVESQRTKHFGVKYHYVREKVLTREVTLTYLHTGAMLADMFTKPVPTDKLRFCCAGIGFLDAQGNAED